MQSLKSWILPISIAFLSACGDNQDPTGVVEFWQRLQQENYRAWERAPGWETRKGSTHADGADVYVNDVVKAALDAGPPLAAWPIGSLIVKDGWDGNEFDIVAAMEKRADNEWYWAEWYGDGTAFFSGKPPKCIGCHSSGADFVRAFGFPK